MALFFFDISPRAPSRGQLAPGGKQMVGNCGGRQQHKTHLPIRQFSIARVILEKQACDLFLRHEAVRVHAAIRTAACGLYVGFIRISCRFRAGFM